MRKPLASERCQRSAGVQDTQPQGGGSSATVGWWRVAVTSKFVTDGYPLFRISLLHHSNLLLGFSRPNILGSSENEALKSLPVRTLSPLSLG